LPEACNARKCFFERFSRSCCPSAIYP
jgi:hypothetical protein